MNAILYSLFYLELRYNALMEMMLDGTGPLVSAQGYCTAKIRPLHIYKL